MPAVSYPITKPTVGSVVAASTMNTIVYYINAERTRRGQGTTSLPNKGAEAVTASHLNSAFSYINSWNGTGYSVAAGSVITAAHIALLIDGLNTAGSDPLLVQIPSEGSITAYFGLQYRYGNPTVLTWSRSGSTLTWQITSYTTYCGNAKSGSGAVTIVQTTDAAGAQVERADWTFGHSKDCCNGNENYVWEYYTLMMNGNGTASLFASSGKNSQSGC